MKNIIKLVTREYIINTLLDKNNITEEIMDKIYMKLKKDNSELNDYGWKDLYLSDIQNIIDNHINILK